jgi:hypothetical protein
MFSYVLFYSFRNTCPYCLRSISICFVLADVVNIIKVSMFPKNERVGWLLADLAILFQNWAYCLLALRYLFVVRGNKYIM